jgi:hypothetical protein
MAIANRAQQITAGQTVEGNGPTPSLAEQPDEDSDEYGGSDPRRDE